MIDLDGKRVDKKDDEDGGKDKKPEIGTDFGLKTDQVNSRDIHFGGKFELICSIHSSTVVTRR